MVIDIIALSCVVVGIIIFTFLVLGREKENNISKLLYYWLIPLGLRIMVIVGLAIAFKTEKSKCIIVIIGSIIPLWATTIVLVIETVAYFVLAKKLLAITVRYLLDVLPIGQMKIDKELNLGLISEIEAKEKRQRIVSDSLFNGVLEQVLKYEKFECSFWIFTNIVLGILATFRKNIEFRTFLAGGSVVVSASMLLSMVVIVVLLRRVESRIITSLDDIV